MSEFNKALGLKFQCKIVNGDSSDKKIAILAGPFFNLGTSVTQSGSSPYAVSAVAVHAHDTTEINAGGFTVDGIMDDGTVATSTVCTALIPTFKIREFREFLRFNPQVLTELQIQADNAAVFSETITFSQWTPMYDTGKQYLNLSNYYDPYQNQATKIVIKDINMILSNRTVMIMNIAAGRTVTFTFVFGGEVN